MSGSRLGTSIFVLAFLLLALSVQGAGQLQVVLEFDDAWRCQYYNALPILEEYGFTGTFLPFVIDHGRGFGETDTPYMTWEEMLDLQNRGMEIGSQGWSHPDYITKLSGEEIIREVVYSKDEFEKRGFEIYGWTYPNDVWNEEIMELVREHYDYGVPQSYVYESSPVPRDGDRHMLEATAVTNEILSEFVEYLRGVNETHTVILIYHEVEDKGGRFVTTVENFREQMQYLHDNGYVGVSFKEYFGLGGDPLVSEFEALIRVVIIAMIILLTVYVFYRSGK